MRFVFSDTKLKNKTGRQEGFTLVELAIVLTIIGLLIGGILKGQQMIENSRVTSTLSRVKATEAAVTAFRDTYRGVPGDMTMADRKVPGCTVVCSNTGSFAGDGIVGDASWNMEDIQRTTVLTAANTTDDGETILFWVELLKAGYISGYNDDGITAGKTLTFGGSYPSAPVGGGFIVGYSDGRQDGDDIGREDNAGDYSLVGTILALAPKPTSDLNDNQAQQVLTPSLAAQMDRKMDDGKPDTGSIQAFGREQSCYTNDTAPFLYAESVRSKDCGLFFLIQ